MQHLLQAAWLQRLDAFAIELPPDIASRDIESNGGIGLFVRGHEHHMLGGDQGICAAPPGQTQKGTLATRFTFFGKMFRMFVLIGRLHHLFRSFHITKNVSLCSFQPSTPVCCPSNRVRRPNG